jgi:hypothetical protein
VTVGSIAGVSPRFTARMAGLFYLLYVVMAGIAGFARRGILIGGDAAATAYRGHVVRIAPRPL